MAPTAVQSCSQLIIVAGNETGYLCGCVQLNASLPELFIADPAVLVDEQALDTIESTFRQFSTFLDLLHSKG